MNKEVLFNLCKDYCKARFDLEANSSIRSFRNMHQFDRVVKVVEDLLDFKFVFKNSNGILSATFFDANNIPVASSLLAVSIDLEEVLKKIFSEDAQVIGNSEKLLWLTLNSVSSCANHTITATYSDYEVVLNNNYSLTLNTEEENGLRLLFLYYGFTSKIELVVNRYSHKILSVNIFKED